MSTLWVFGDSFVNEENYHLNFKNTSDWCWTRNLAKKLGCDELRVNGTHGVGNEFIWYMISELKTKIKPEDYIVVVTSSVTRRWLFKNYPNYSNILGLHEGGWASLSKKQKKSLKNFVQDIFLDSANEIGHIHLELVLHWIYQTAQWRNWRNFFVIAGFESQPLHSVDFSLCDLEVSEFAVCEWKQDFLDNSEKIDKRIMHLSKDNHLWLSEKIYQWFQADDKRTVDFSIQDRKPIFNDHQSMINWKLEEHEYNIVDDDQQGVSRVYQI